MAERDQLIIPLAARADADSFELLRVWITKKGQHISMREAYGMIRPRGVSCWLTWHVMSRIPTSKRANLIQFEHWSGSKPDFWSS